MSLVKIGPRHQITIPKQVRLALHLEAGDLLEVVVKEGKGFLIPKKLVEMAPAPKLTKKGQALLVSAKAKIRLIQTDLKNSKGLSTAEADVAARVGLIDPDQRYWWLEEWQQGEREAERESASEETAPTFDDASAAIAFLKSQTA